MIPTTSVKSACRRTMLPTSTTVVVGIRPRISSGVVSSSTTTNGGNIFSNKFSITTTASNSISTFFNNVRSLHHDRCCRNTHARQIQTWKLISICATRNGKCQKQSPFPIHMYTNNIYTATTTTTTNNNNHSIQRYWLSSLTDTSSNTATNTTIAATTTDMDSTSTHSNVEDSCITTPLAVSSWVNIIAEAAANDIPTTEMNASPDVTTENIESIISSNTSTIQKDNDVAVLIPIRTDEKVSDNTNSDTNSSSIIMDHSKENTDAIASPDVSESNIESIIASNTSILLESNDLSTIMPDEKDSGQNNSSSIIMEDSRGSAAEINNENEINDPSSSLPVHDIKEREKLDHPLSSIKTDVSNNDIDKGHNIAAQSNDTHSNSKIESSQGGKMSLSSFMAGERPIITDKVEEAPNRETKSHAINPRPRNPLYYKYNGTAKSPTDTLNGFIPKASSQKVKPPTVHHNYTKTQRTWTDVESNNQKQNPIKTKAIKEMLSNVGKQLLLHTKLQPRIPNQLVLLGDHLIAQGEKILPKSTWVHVEGISPVSSLDAVLDGIQHALDVEEQNGIVNLDATWNETESIPFLQISDSTSNIDDTRPKLSLSSTEPTSMEIVTVKPHKWVRKAKLIISPFARPTGWYLKFENRSIVYALLRHAQEHPIRSSWRPIRIKEYKNRMEVEQTNDANTIDNDPISYGNFILNDDISDATLRVENCPWNVSEASMLNFFSRYDLKNSVGKNNDKPIQQWSGTTEDGKQCPPSTYLVHFADTAWARAALREKQGTYMSKMGQAVLNYKNPKPLHLVQYPRQIL